MGRLAERLVAEIQSASAVKDLESCLWKASDLLLKASSPGFKSGFEEIDSEHVSATDAAQLQRALVDALARNSDPRWVGSILSALSVTRDPSSRSLWVNYLAKYLELLKAANGVVYGALLALDSLGEPVFEEGANGRNLTDIERNAERATKYLHQQGITVPW